MGALFSVRRDTSVRGLAVVEWATLDMSAHASAKQDNAPSGRLSD